MIDSILQQEYEMQSSRIFFFFKVIRNVENKGIDLHLDEY